MSAGVAGSGRRRRPKQAEDDAGQEQNAAGEKGEFHRSGGEGVMVARRRERQFAAPECHRACDTKHDDRDPPGYIIVVYPGYRSGYSFTIRRDGAG